MCGICGTINFDNKPVDRDMLIRMRDSMHHRGPDDEGVFWDGSVGLGHRRLSIIDLSTGRQPMSNEDDSIVIVFNGEIYNFQSLRESLIKRGHIFKTRSDTEVIIHLYEEEGIECLESLRGMFAFAIWDKRKEQLCLARDRLGIKPVYYYCDNKVFLFASEMKALLQCRDIKPELNERGLIRYLKYRFVYGKEALFKGIYELLPGQCMLVTSENRRMIQYWTPSFCHDASISFASLKEQIIASLEESVQLRMISDVPIGVFLSGGIDSSAVTALMSRNAQNVQTFSIGFVPEELNELNFARIVADRFRSDHHEYFLDSADFFSLLKKLIWHNDEPLMFPASVPLYLLSKYSKDHATVMLAGEGADELFAGYESNIKAYWLHRIRNLVPSIIKGKLMKLPVNSKYKAIIEKTILNDKQLIHSFFQLYKDDIISQVYDCSNLEDFMDDSLMEEIGFDNVEGSFIEKLLYFQMKTYLVALLMKQDKMSMAASIETRVPFLDHHFVHLACQIPSEYKVRRGHGKYIFKKACEGLLPKSIIYRKKMGFPVPIEAWFRTKGNPFIEVLLDSSTKKNSFLNYNFIQNTVRDFESGVPNAAQHIWTLINLELWRREFLGG